MGGVDKIDQQLHGINIISYKCYKCYKWYHKVFFRLLCVAMLSCHKIYRERGGNSDFLQFVHDIVLGLVEKAPHLRGIPRKKDNLVRLTGRHFPAQSLYQGNATKRKHCPKICRVCYARGRRTEAGHVVKSTIYCEQCPEKPGLCLGECFKTYHTKIDYSS